MAVSPVVCGVVIAGGVVVTVIWPVVVSVCVLVFVVCVMVPFLLNL